MDGGQKVLRTSTHLVRSRMGSLRVARYRPVLEMAKLNSQTQNPAYVRSRPTFCIPKTICCGPQRAVFGSRHPKAGMRLTLSQACDATVGRAAAFCVPNRGPRIFSVSPGSRPGELGDSKLGVVVRI